MNDARTTVTAVPVADFIAAVTPDIRRDEARLLDALFREATGFVPRMWGPSIVGYGRYGYRYDSGRTGESCATGFSPRGRAISVYVVPGFAALGPLLSRLGPHETGKSCLYLKRLGDIDHAVLKEVIRAGIADLRTRWEVFPE